MSRIQPAEIHPLRHLLAAGETPGKLLSRWLTWTFDTTDYVVIAGWPQDAPLPEHWVAANDGPASVTTALTEIDPRILVVLDHRCLAVALTCEVPGVLVATSELHEQALLWERGRAELMYVSDLDHMPQPAGPGSAAIGAPCEFVFVDDAQPASDLYLMGTNVATGEVSIPARPPAPELVAARARADDLRRLRREHLAAVQARIDASPSASAYPRYRRQLLDNEFPQARARPWN